MNWSVNSINTIGRSASSLKKEPFNSGKTELDRYLKQYAKKNDERGIARTFVAFAFEESQAVEAIATVAPETRFFEKTGFLFNR